LPSHDPFTTISTSSCGNSGGKKNCGHDFKQASLPGRRILPLAQSWSVLEIGMPMRWVELGAGRPEAEMRRVAIIEDHPLMQSALEATLERADGFTVVGTATSGLQAEPLVSRTLPDLVLLDLHLPELDGLSCLALLRERHPEATVVVLSGIEDDEMIERALAGGAAALVRKSIAPADLPVLLRQVLLGSVHFATPRIARAVVTQATHQSQLDEARAEARGETGLSARELEVLEAVARGLTNRAVAAELFVSDQTVKRHLRRIFRKLGVANRTEAARTAYRLGLHAATGARRDVAVV
jgi:DNA-binding NarL/FixJ family response regulator